MPELPEVETIVRELCAAGLAGRTVCDARVHWSRTLAEPGMASFRRRMTGRRIVSVARRAKYMVLTLDGAATLLVHLRMTGRFALTPAAGPVGPHERVTLRLDNGLALRFSDPRKFGRWWLTDHPDRVLGKLGPEPLDRAFSLSVFRARLAGRRGMLKPLLLDQRFVAGIGNIYADEALWTARLHPRRQVDTLAADESRRLHRAIRTVLRRGVRSLGTSLSGGQTAYRRLEGGYGNNRERLHVFRRTGLPCPRCGTDIRRIRVGQRSTHICPLCQVAPVPLGKQGKSHVQMAPLS